MKAFILIVLMTSVAFGQGEMPAQDLNDYKQLSDRFVTSVKEAQIDKQYLQVPEIKECLTKNKITEADLKDTAVVEKKQKDAAKCVKDKFSQLDEGKITDLSKQLGLEAFGVVKGKGSSEVIDYFAKRLENALYGVNAANEPYKLKGQKMVDQRVFVDLYETQIGKNILLEISNYCLNSFDPGMSSTDLEVDRFNKIANLNLSDASIANYNDKDIAAADVNDNSKIYDEFMTNVVGGTSATPEQTKEKLSKIFGNCTAVIPKMCEYHEYCACKAKPAADGVDCAKNRFAKLSPPPTCDLKKGQNSCHVVARLRGFRTNLMALAKTKEQFDQIQSISKIKFLTPASGVYDSKSTTPGESIDDLTSLNSADVDKIKSSEDLKKQSDDFEKLDCEKKPDEPKCFSYYYNEDETVNFANNKIAYSAATIIETQKISKLTDKEKLVEYLNTRGYFELAERAKKGENTENLIKEAQLLFETEREATYSKMEEAFNRKQLVNTEGGSKTDKQATSKKEIKNKNKEFQQLLVFNNVVSSYLSLQKRDKSGKLQDAGLNVQALKREFESAKGSKAEDAKGLEYFSKATSAENKFQNGENPIVDLNFLDSVLGSEDAKKTEDERKKRDATN